MTYYLAIDPGSEQSGWVKMCDDVPQQYGISENVALVCDELQRVGHGCRTLVIEQVASYGMPVSESVFETVRWSGRFEQWWLDSEGACVVYLPRMAVKMYLCHHSRAKPANTRQALIDLYGGKAKAIGPKKRPGPLHGITSHAWSALELAITWWQTRENSVGKT